MRNTYRTRSRPTSDNEQDDEDEVEGKVDPKVQKEIDELSKIPESGVGRVSSFMSKGISGMTIF